MLETFKGVDSMLNTLISAYITESDKHYHLVAAIEGLELSSLTAALVLVQKEQSAMQAT